MHIARRPMWQEVPRIANGCNCIGAIVDNKRALHGLSPNKATISRLL